MDRTMVRRTTGTLVLLLLFACRSNAFAPEHARTLPILTPSSRKAVVLKAAANSAAKSNVGLALAGKITPFLSKFAINREKGRKIVTALAKVTHPVDLALIAYIGWFAEPLVRFVYEKFFEKFRKIDFDKTYLFYLHQLASEASRIAALVYAMDCLDVTLTTMGIEVAKKFDFGAMTANVAYPLWIGRKLSLWKRRFLRRQVRKLEGGNKKGKFFLLNRLLDLLIAIVTLLSVADRLSIETGKALDSVFALGSVGTLVISLASRGIAEQFVSGLALSTTDKFYEGDEVLLGDGTNGIVKKIGWMSTDIRKGDEIVVKIPNSQIASQRVSNISRMKLCAVKQTLRFKYEDIDKIPKVLSDIKSEVKKACSKVILDGTRPFRAHWRDFEGDHIEVVVDFRFRLPPTGDVYFDNREKCLLAIAKAAKMNGVEFAIPTVVSYNKIENDDMLGLVGLRPPAE